jgi:hypothetical protein
MFHCDYSQFVKYRKYRKLIEIFNVFVEKIDAFAVDPDA